MPAKSKERFGGHPSREQTEKWLISNNRREIDLVSVISDRNVLHVETKSAPKNESDAVSKGTKQLEWFKCHMERTHGEYLKGVTYIPTIAMPNSTPTLTLFCYCKKPVQTLVVQEGGINHGRKYEVCCKNGKGTSACQFFKWSDSSNYLLHDSHLIHDPNCSSTEPVKVTAPEQTSKKGKSKAKKEKKEPRQFLICPLEEHMQCKYFKWVDEADMDLVQNNLPAPKYRDTIIQNSANHILLKKHFDNEALLHQWLKDNIIDKSRDLSTKSEDSDTSDLTRRLVTLSAMVFTKMAHYLSHLTTDSQMILLRWEVLFTITIFTHTFFLQKSSV